MALIANQRSKLLKKDRKGNKYSVYNKKHFDVVFDKDKTQLSTLSYDKDRTKKGDMFYATVTDYDKNLYNYLFNHPVPKEITDSNGNKIGTGQCLKMRITNSIKNSIKVASEDTGAKAFADLYSNDRDFYNFVTDKNRMQSYFVSDKYKFKGCRESRDAIEKVRNGQEPSYDYIKTIYRMFNYTIPYDGNGNQRNAKDIATQRAKFFNVLKSNNYSAVLDTNDALYGGYKADYPIIVFDTSKCISTKIENVSIHDRNVSKYIYLGRKAIGYRGK